MSFVPVETIGTIGTFGRGFLDEFITFAKENNVFGTVMGFMVGAAGKELASELIQTLVDPIIVRYKIDERISAQHQNLLNSLLSLVLTLLLMFGLYKLLQIGGF